MHQKWLYFTFQLRKAKVMRPSWNSPGTFDRFHQTIRVSSSRIELEKCKVVKLREKFNSLCTYPSCKVKVKEILTYILHVRIMHFYVSIKRSDLASNTNRTEERVSILKDKTRQPGGRPTVKMEY